MAWPEADRLFRTDPLWLGGDGAFSIDLGDNQVLWLFGDSFVVRKPGQQRKESRMLRNTLAIQTGYDPSRASMKYYWRTRRGQPESFFQEQGGNWLWPMHGVRLGDHLLLLPARTTHLNLWDFAELGGPRFSSPISRKTHSIGPFGESSLRSTPEMLR